MKKKMKWIALSLVVVLLAVMVYMAFLVRHAESEAQVLTDIKHALEATSEVESVRDIHRFNGLEAYVVALVELADRQTAYFFIRDGVVVHYAAEDELLNAALAIELALYEVDGEVHHAQMGILEETPIFEVQIRVDDALHFVVLDATTAEVKMTFQLPE